MSFLSENLRYLRAQTKCSQQQVANALIISRGRYSKYEDGKSEPPLAILLRISHYFEVSIDLLISADLRSISEAERYSIYKSVAGLV
jgi:transcriptional regulator with XRE-family HTH domain